MQLVTRRRNKPSIRAATCVAPCPSATALGQLTQVTDGLNYVAFRAGFTDSYDAHGNVTQKSQVQSSATDVVHHTYTAADRLSSITKPSGTVTHYIRDNAGRISGVVVTPSGGSAQTVVSAISYLPFGPVSGYTLGNGQVIVRTYDANYQLTDLVSPALNLHFARDAMGNITALGHTPGANPAIETYSSDPL